MSHRRSTVHLVAALVPATLFMAVSGALLTGCSSSVSGTATSSGVTGASGSPSGLPTGAPTGVLSVDLAELLLAPESFPPQYPAIILPPQAVAQAAPDLTGVPVGAVVEPVECTPPEHRYSPADTAMAVGTNNDSRTTISVVVTREAHSLEQWTDDLRECDLVAVTSAGAKSQVESKITPARPVAADESVAVRRTVTSGSSGTQVHQSMVTLLAQSDGIRVSVTLMYFGDQQPDLAPLDEVFVEAIGAAGL